jgi:hypothetical protein
MDKSVFLELVSSLSNDAINDYFREEYKSIMDEVTRLDMIIDKFDKKIREIRDFLLKV